MNSISFSESFDKSFSRIKDKSVKKQIWDKILELEDRAPIGKKLKGHPFWSVHIGKYRLVYHLESEQITIAHLLERKFEYRELR